MIGGVLEVSGESRSNTKSVSGGREFSFGVINNCTGFVSVTATAGVAGVSKEYYLPPGGFSEYTSISTQGPLPINYNLFLVVSYTGNYSEEGLCCLMQYAYSSLEDLEILPSAE